jgi:D-sedoheptulose 7-phosphate isomerase
VRALKVALIVGPLLTVINQWQAVAGTVPLDWTKVVLTLLVPYCVATLGAVGMRRKYLAEADKHHKDGHGLPGSSALPTIPSPRTIVSPPANSTSTMTSPFLDYLTSAQDLLVKARDAGLEDRVEAAIAAMADALSSRKPVLVCGNGGSAADAQHIAGELVARFLVERPGLKVIDLVSNSATITAWSNDYDYQTVFARQVEAFGEPGGVLVAISTSGNSANVVAACERARQGGLTVIGLTGAGGGRMKGLCDVLLDVPSTETPRIQEVHVVLYHFICQQVEARCAAGSGKGS